METLSVTTEGMSMEKIDMGNDNMPAGCTEDDGFGILPEPMEDPDYVPDVFDAERYMDYFTKKYHMDSDSSADDIQNRIMDASDSGDVEATFDLGVLFLVSCNEPYYSIIDAYKWFRKAAEMGYAAGQFQVGRQYQYGIGVERDMATAISWYEKSAEQGYPCAENNLGVIYFDGGEFKKDYEKALYYFESAAKKRDPIAMCNLADLYRVCEGREMNYPYAGSLLKMAAAVRNHFNPAKDRLWSMIHDKEIDENLEIIEEAKTFMLSDEEDWSERLHNEFNARHEAKIMDYDDLWIYFGDERGSSWDPEESNLHDVAEWYLRCHKAPSCWDAVEWDLEEGKRKGDAEYIYYYARYMFFGTEKYEELMEESANQGYAAAMSEMGFLRSDWDRFTEDSVQWYRKAAEAGDARGQWKYAEYLFGMAVGEDDHFSEVTSKEEIVLKYFDEGLRWSEAAADKGEASAMCMMGDIFANGVKKRIEKDESKAYEWYRKASEAGDYRGSKACAIALEEGRGVDVDYAAARHYYEKGTEEFSNYSEGFDEEMQFRWGRLIYNGLGGDADKEEGAYMMRSAVEETHYVDWDDPNGIRDLMKRWGIKKHKRFIETVRFSYGIPQDD